MRPPFWRMWHSSGSSRTFVCPSLHLQVELLMSERKEAKEAVQAQADTMKQAQAQANSFQMLMPLALPAPAADPAAAAAAGYGMHPAAGFGGAAAGFTGQPGYGGGY